MLILVTCLLLFATAAALLILRALQPNARYTWLVASGGAAFALISVFFWLAQMPSSLNLPVWQPLSLFPTPIAFTIDGISWALTISICSLTLAVLLTSVTRSVITNSLSWAGILALGGIGILAVTANNPLTLLLVWAFIDLIELISQLSSVNGEKQSEQIVISFSTRAFGIALLLWSYIESSMSGNSFSFQTMSANTGAYLVIAAGLRLGVLPLHLPYSAGSFLRRGFGTSLRLIGAAASLSILMRVTISPSGLTPYLMILTTIAALYGGWMWLRAPDELNARPYWMIGIASLAILSALSGNPVGAAAWGCVLIFAGGALFLSSVQNLRLNRALLIGVWSLSALPFSLTGSAWMGSFNFITPFALIAQALMMAGFIRHALRSTASETLDDQPGWAKIVYPAGIIVLLAAQILLGFIGWEGAFESGSWIQAMIASLLTLGLVWGFRRFRIFNPVRAHWVSAAGAGVNSIYQWLWSLYRGLARLSQTITESLEGEGGIMWTLLFLALFILVITRGN